MLLFQNQKIFSRFFSALAEYTSYFKYFEKKHERGSSFVSEVIDFKKRCYLNSEKAAYQSTYGQLKG